MVRGRTSESVHGPRWVHTTGALGGLAGPGAGLGREAAHEDDGEKAAAGQAFEQNAQRIEHLRHARPARSVLPRLVSSGRRTSGPDAEGQGQGRTRGWSSHTSDSTTIAASSASASASRSATCGERRVGSPSDACDPERCTGRGHDDRCTGRGRVDCCTGRDHDVPGCRAVASLQTGWCAQSPACGQTENTANEIDIRHQTRGRVMR